MAKQDAIGVAMKAIPIVEAEAKQMKEKTGFKKGWRGGPGRGKKMVANDCPPPFSGESDKPKRDSKTKDEKSTVGMLSTLLSVPMREARKLVKFKRAVNAGHIKEDVVAKSV